MISIVVPVYKVEKYLNKCVDSILNQTYKDLEIILVDDGSPDGCPQICDDYAKKDSRIKVVHKKNGGLMSARQTGLEAAAGAYIGFVDGDDWIEPDMYMHFYHAVSKYQPDIVVSEFYSENENELVTSNQNLSKPFFTKDEMIQEVYPFMLYKAPYFHFGVFPCCWAKLYKKDLLEKCLYSVPLETKIGEDAAFTYPCFLLAERLAYVDKPCYHYVNSREQSITTAYDADMENTILIPYKILKQAFDKINFDFSDTLNYYLFYLLEFIIRNEASVSNLKSKKQIKATLKKFMNRDIITSLGKINMSDLPFRKKVVLFMFKIKSPQLLFLYIKLLKKLK